MFSQRRLLLALLLSALLHLLLAVSFDVVWGKLVLFSGDAEPLLVRLETVRDLPREKPPAMPEMELAPSPPATLEETLTPQPAPDLAKKYYTLKELDVPPEPVAPVEPEYPPDVPADIHGGLVRLQLLLDEQGKVEDVSVLSSTPQGYFEQAAIAAFQKAVFTPGIRQGVAVPSEIRIYLRFGAR